MGLARHTDCAGVGEGGDAGSGVEGNGTGTGVGGEGATGAVAAAGEATAGGGGEVRQQGERRGCRMRSGGMPLRVAAWRDNGVAAWDGSRDRVSFLDRSRARAGGKGTLIEMIMTGRLREQKGGQNI